MKRAICIALCYVLLLASAIPAMALTTGEKDSIYKDTIKQLETYLEDQLDDYEQLDDINDKFLSLKGFEKSSGFADYVTTLMLITGDEIDTYELGFQLMILEKNTEFISYLENEFKGSAIGTVEDLKNYVQGREAENQKDYDGAVAFYGLCLHYFDSSRRYKQLYRSSDVEHYEKALELFAEHDFEAAYHEFALAGNYGQSAERMEFIVNILGYTPVQEHEHEWLPATCLVPKTCSICQTTEGAPLPHNMDEGRVTKQANCNENGEIVYTCKDCGTTDVKVIRATGNHKWGEGVETSAQTCTASGKKTYTCFVCGEQKVEEIAKAGEHNWDKGKVTKEATCTENGTKTYTCTRCGETRKETINATGSHNWGSGRVTKEPTTSANGERTFTCSSCGKTRTEAIAPLTPEYSDWVDTLPAGKTATDTKTQYRSREITTEYRYRDLETKTSKDTQLDGDWMLVSSEMYYGSWSDYSETPVTASESLDVESKQQEQTKQVTVWKYTRWEYVHVDHPNSLWYSCVDYSKQNPAKVKKVYGWKSTSSRTRFTYKGWSGGCQTYEDSNGKHWYNEAESTDNVTETVTVYRSRKIGIKYTYQRWGDWSAWSTDAVNGSSTRKVEMKNSTGSWSGWKDKKISPSDTVEVQTRTLYRYQVN